MSPRPAPRYARPLAGAVTVLVLVVIVAVSVGLFRDSRPA